MYKLWYNCRIKFYEVSGCSKGTEKTLYFHYTMHYHFRISQPIMWVQSKNKIQKQATAGLHASKCEIYLKIIKNTIHCHKVGRSPFCTVENVFQVHYPLQNGPV